jgi:endonuclease YncB( thermonuclease family)
MIMKPAAFAFALSVLASSPALAYEVSGQARVIDGDTIEMEGAVIRLFGIDAAETGQRCVTSKRKFVRPGDAASDRVGALVKEGVTCKGDEFDAYGRLIGICTTLSGANINRTLVEEGLAWAFVKYSDAYINEERQARHARRGVWQLACEEPWVFREKRWKVAEQKAPNGCPIKGNISTNGHIYHTPWSRHYAGTKIDVAKGERWFCSEADALKAGFRAPIR